jgi:hypothetical protein
MATIGTVTVQSQPVLRWSNGRCGEYDNSVAINLGLQPLGSDCTSADLAAQQEKDELEAALKNGDAKTVQAKFEKDSGKALAIVLGLAKELNLPKDVFKDLLTTLSNISKWDNPALRLQGFQHVGVLIGLYKASPGQIRYHLRNLANPVAGMGYDTKDPKLAIKTLDAIVNHVSQRREVHSLAETLSVAGMALFGELLIKYAGQAAGVLRSRVAGGVRPAMAKGVDDALDRLTTPGTSNAINPSGSNSNCVLCVQAGDDFLATGALRAAGEAPSGGLPISALEKAYRGTFSPKQVNANSIVDDLLEAGNSSRSIVKLSPLSGDTGHVINAVNYNGTVAFIDFQSGRLFTSAADLTAWAHKNGLFKFSSLPTTPR